MLNHPTSSHTVHLKTVYKSPVQIRRTSHTHKSKKMLFAVFYERKVPIIERGFLWELTKAFMGPIIHVELVFVKDMKCDCFNISARCPNGYATIEKDKRYILDDPEETFVYRWVRIKAEHEIKARMFCEEAVRCESFQISEAALIGCIMPPQFSRFFEFAFTNLFQVKFDLKPPVTPCTPVHCAGLMARVLRDGCGIGGIPINCTGSGLLHHLLNVCHFELSTNPFGTFKQWKVRDKANFKRSLNTILEENDGYIA